MEHRDFGRTGLKIMPLVFGWTIDEARSFAVLDAFDTADYTAPRG
ncbi:hypothetical protein [Paenirhodobacter sp.]